MAPPPISSSHAKYSFLENSLDQVKIELGECSRPSSKFVCLWHSIIFGLSMSLIFTWVFVIAYLQGHPHLHPKTNGTAYPPPKELFQNLVIGNSWRDVEALISIRNLIPGCRVRVKGMEGLDNLNDDDIVILKKMRFYLIEDNNEKKLNNNNNYTFNIIQNMDQNQEGYSNYTITGLLAIPDPTPKKPQDLQCSLNHTTWSVKTSSNQNQSQTLTVILVGRTLRDTNSKTLSEQGQDYSQESEGSEQHEFYVY